MYSCLLSVSWPAVDGNWDQTSVCVFWGSVLECRVRGLDVKMFEYGNDLYKVSCEDNEFHGGLWAVLESRGDYEKRG